jgi:nitroimidazol reductase NimA-like FMN-containing flavoprotein (pyridoxamine 5'-phosphate oxidase superfamily)
MASVAPLRLALRASSTSLLDKSGCRGTRRRPKVTGVTTFDATTRTTLRRLPDRGSYDIDLVDSILDEGLLAHVALNDQAHGPIVLPMTFARIDDRLYLHGALSNRVMRGIADGEPVCITVTLLDALVMSRAAFHHSMNYRCVVVFGRGERVTDRDEMLAASATLVERMEPGRSAKARVPSEAELRKTLIVRVPLVEVSAKVRTGPPVEEPEDVSLPVWGGIVPMSLVRGEAVPDGLS